MAKEKKEKKPKSKARKIVEWVLTGLFLVLFAIAGVAQIDGLVNKNKHYGQQIRLGYATFVVKTESMEPKYMVDSAIITYLEDADKIYERYQNNEVVDVTFYDVYTAETEYTKPLNHPELTMRTNPAEYPIITHRVKEIHVNNALAKGEGKYTFIVAGINTGVGAATNANGEIYQYQVFTEKELLGRVVIGSAFLGGIFNFVSSIWGLLILLLIPSFYLIIVSVIDIFKAYKEPEEQTATANGASANNPSNSKELSEEDKKRLKEELLQEMLGNKKGDK